jgi:hypothetical protein
VFFFEATLSIIEVDPHTYEITSTRAELAHAHDECSRHMQATVSAARLLVHTSVDGWSLFAKPVIARLAWWLAVGVLALAAGCPSILPSISI